MILSKKKEANKELYIWWGIRLIAVKEKLLRKTFKIFVVNFQRGFVKFLLNKAQEYLNFSEISAKN